jgi:hypothetical protein
MGMWSASYSNHFTPGRELSIHTGKEGGWQMYDGKYTARHYYLGASRIGEGKITITTLMHK